MKIYPIKSPIPGRIKFLHSWFEHDYVDFSERRLKHDRTKRCSLRRTSAYFCDRFRNCSHEFLGLAPRISIGRWARTTGIPMPPRRHFCTPVTFVSWNRRWSSIKRNPFFRASLFSSFWTTMIERMIDTGVGHKRKVIWTMCLCLFSRERSNIIGNKYSRNVTNVNFFLKIF